MIGGEVFAFDRNFIARKCRHRQVVQISLRVERRHATSTGGSNGLPVRRILEMHLSERQSQQTGEIVATLDPATILPYAHQRYDDIHPAG